MSHQFVSLLVSLRFKLINLDWKSPKTLITDEPADSRSLTAPTPSSQLEPQPASICVCVCVSVCVCVCLQCHAFIVWTHCCCRSKPTSSGYKTMAVAAPMDSLTSQHAAEFRAHRVHLRCPRSALLLFTLTLSFSSTYSAKANFHLIPGKSGHKSWSSERQILHHNVK